MTTRTRSRVDISRGAPDLYRALAALLYATVVINGWNRLAVPTHMVFEP